MKTILLICMMVFVNGIDDDYLSHRGLVLKHNPPPPPAIDERKIAAIIQDNFSQKLDHYDPTNTVTWSQRYFVNDAYFDTVERNVAFLFVSGEGAASATWMSYGSWIVTAKKYKALLFQLEHRFYGNSQPFPDLSLENLRYLSSQQALADLATFIVAMNKKYQLSPDVKWILFGGSYAGSLAAWMREKYPHLVHGAMDASGPLWAKLDYYEYVQVIVDDITSSSQECTDTIRIGINQLESLLRSPSREVVTHMFNLCDPIEEIVDNDLDLARFFQGIKTVFASVAQSSHLPGSATTFDDLCAVLTNKTIGTEVDRLAEVFRSRHGANCLRYSYSSEVEYLKDVTIHSDGDRQWIYQECTEFGWYQTTNQEVQVFGNRNPVDFYIKTCTDVFGDMFNEDFVTEQTERTNMDYGALNIEASNIVHVHGSFDPWHAAGLTKTTNPDSPAILINGAGHCSNFYEESPTDLPELKAAREEVDRLIGVWLEKN